MFVYTVSLSQQLLIKNILLEKTESYFYLFPRRKTVVDVFNLAVSQHSTGNCHLVEKIWSRRLLPVESVQNYPADVFQDVFSGFMVHTSLAV